MAQAISDGPIGGPSLADRAAQLCGAHLWCIIPLILYIVFIRGFSVVWAVAFSLGCQVLYSVLALAVADADIGLLACGPAPEDAFRDKTVLVVGASRGIGASLARHLSKAGAVLILAARREADLQARPCYPPLPAAAFSAYILQLKPMQALAGAPRTTHAQHAHTSAGQANSMLHLCSQWRGSTQDVKESLEGRNSERASVLTVDVTADGEALERFARTADALHGGIDYAFLAAGAPLLLLRL